MTNFVKIHLTPVVSGMKHVDGDDFPFTNLFYPLHGKKKHAKM
jgi:hypothetical protein